MNKNIYLLSSCILSLLAAPCAAGAETIQSTPQQNTEQQIQSDLAAITQQKVLVQEEIELTTTKLKDLNQQITNSNSNIQNKENELILFQKKIDRLNIENAKITFLLKKREKEFKERVASYYRTDGQMSFLNVIFSINSFGEFIDHYVAYHTIVNQDKKFIEDYIADQNQVTNNVENVQALQQSAIKEKEDLVTETDNLDKSKQEKVLLSNILNAKVKQLEQEEQQKKISLELLQKNGQQILDYINQRSKVNAADIQLVNSIIAPFIPDAQRLQQVTSTPASITLGQIILESSGDYNGLSGLAFGAKNLFGIKGTGTAGSVNMQTTEYVNGHPTVTTCQFASYKTYYDSMLDHAKLFLTPRYQKYLKNVTNIVDYANGIQEAGYATDPNYANKLLEIIYQYNFWKLDR